MGRKSLLEEILETAVKKPAVGAAIGIILFVTGLYISSRQATKPQEMLFIPAMHLFGTIFYILSIVVLVVSGFSYMITAIKNKKKIIGSSSNKTSSNKMPKFKTKEEYFRWKESKMGGPKNGTHNDSSDSEHFSTTFDLKKDEKYFADILELNGNYTLENIKHKYHDLILKYHPDRVEHLGDEFKIIAEKKSKELNEAYEHFMKKAELNSAWTVNSIYEALGKIDWYQFERFSAALLKNEGYAVERKGGAHPDGGVDLIATKDGAMMLVQCKHWKTWEIKPKTVREMVGTMKINQVNRGVVYTIKGASKDALDLATQQCILIEEGYSLADRALRNLSRGQLDEILTNYTHHCPKCDSEMILREGDFKSFWGCSRYPKCHGKLGHTVAR